MFAAWPFEGQSIQLRRLGKYYLLGILSRSLRDGQPIARLRCDTGSGTVIIGSGNVRVKLRFPAKKMGLTVRMRQEENKRRFRLISAVLMVIGSFITIGLDLLSFHLDAASLARAAGPPGAGAHERSHL